MNLLTQSQHQHQHQQNQSCRLLSKDKYINTIATPSPSTTNNSKLDCSAQPKQQQQQINSMYNGGGGNNNNNNGDIHRRYSHNPSGNYHANNVNVNNNHSLNLNNTSNNNTTRNNVNNGMISAVRGSGGSGSGGLGGRTPNSPTTFTHGAARLMASSQAQQQRHLQLQQQHQQMQQHQQLQQQQRQQQQRQGQGQSQKLQHQQQNQQQQQQQQQLQNAGTRMNDVELLRMKNNIEETIRIQKRLESIQRLQQAEALKQSLLHSGLAANKGGVVVSGSDSGSGSSRNNQQGQGNQGQGPNNTNGNVNANNFNNNNMNHAGNPRFVIPSGTNASASTSTSSNNNSGPAAIVPTQRREDERTMPLKRPDALSTLSETAAALANARNSSSSSSNSNNNQNSSSSFVNDANKIGTDRMGMNVGNMINNNNNKMNISTGSNNGQAHSFSSLLSSSNANNQKSLGSHSNSNNKRFLDEITAATAGDNSGNGNGNIGSSTSVPSWLWNAANAAGAGGAAGAGAGGTSNNAAGNYNATLYHKQQLQQQLELLKRRNSMPATSSSNDTNAMISGVAGGAELSSPRLQKRQRLEQQLKELQQRNFIDSLERLKNMNDKKNAFLAQAAAVAQAAAATNNNNPKFSNASSQHRHVGVGVGVGVPSQPQTLRRPSLTSSVASASSTIASNTSQEQQKLAQTLERISKNGGFPMPKYDNNNNMNMKKNVAGVTTVGNDEYAYSGTSEAARNINNGSAKITPELNKDVIQVVNGGTSIGRQQRHNIHDQNKGRNIGGFPMPPFADVIETTTSNNRRINADNTQASRPPTLNSYKRIWRNIRVVAGDDPKVDERLRKEVFARKLQRGDIFTRSNNQHQHPQQQRRLSGIHNNNSNNDSASGSEQEEGKHIVI